ncbi:hypothetical protein OM076_15095 [Solirubrobacter ginsenosidimutans]|uniref:Uncharacterized protein n=1 Tax=Solirubrobacter ginsenosidimutans TaxID=490573 RepID=A0A9X3MUN7_9ACTN|nr:hypothetical protein [Solirubrobacter ginsenosidimutans]MDA0161602.1 hypothetical protein [Solirubrobacter ginsenosidimutans]
MRSISIATWLSLATGWLAAAAAIAVIAAAPDNTPDLLFLPAQPPSQAPLEPTLVGPDHALVTLSTGSVR